MLCHPRSFLLGSPYDFPTFKERIKQTKTVFLKHLTFLQVHVLIINIKMCIIYGVDIGKLSFSQGFSSCSALAGDQLFLMSSSSPFTRSCRSVSQLLLDFLKSYQTLLDIVMCWQILLNIVREVIIQNLNCNVWQCSFSEEVTNKLFRFKKAYFGPFPQYLLFCNRF